LCGSANKTDQNEIETVANILRAAAKGAKKREIMYRCQLHGRVLEKYLYALTELNLLRTEQKGETSYRTTNDGLQLLRTYHRLKWMLKRKTFDFMLVRLLGQIITNKEKLDGNRPPQPYII